MLNVNPEIDCSIEVPVKPVVTQLLYPSPVPVRAVPNGFTSYTSLVRVLPAAGLASIRILKAFVLDLPRVSIRVERLFNC